MESICLMSIRYRSVHSSRQKTVTGHLIHAGENGQFSYFVCFDGFLYSGVIRDNEMRNTVWNQFDDAWDALRQLIHIKYAVGLRAFERKDLRDEIRGLRLDLLDGKDISRHAYSAIRERIMDASKHEWVEEVLRILPEQLVQIEGNPRQTLLERLYHVDQIIDREQRRQRRLEITSPNDYSTLEGIIASQVDLVSEAYWTMLTLWRHMDDGRRTMFGEGSEVVCQQVISLIEGIQIRPFLQHREPLLKDIHKVITSIHSRDVEQVKFHLHRVVKRLTRMQFRIDLDEALVEVTEAHNSGKELDTRNFRYLAIAIKEHAEVISADGPLVGEHPSIGFSQMLQALTCAYDSFEQITTDRERIWANELQRPREDLKRAVTIM
jgi:hypothetical protein